MKKLYIVIFSVFTVFTSAAQDLPDTHTPDILPDTLTIAECPAVPIDTIDTGDKFTKIVLFDDKTWDYIQIGKPGIDSTCIFDSYWQISELHAYKDYNINDIPDEIHLCLVDSTHGYVAPITGKIRSGYKFRRTREHKGIDVPLQIGDTIRAAFDGVVRYVDVTRKTGGYGNLIIIRHSNGLETYYGHLSKTLVKPNEPVKAGEIIGLGGNTGRSTGPHLHFEARYKGQTFDPCRLIDFETGALRDTIFTIKKHYFSIYSHYGQTDEESQAAAGRIMHTVKPGDTLGKIAGIYGTTVTNICKLNGISSNKILKIGERLIVR